MRRSLVTTVSLLGLMLVAACNSASDVLQSAAPQSKGDNSAALASPQVSTTASTDASLSPPAMTPAPAAATPAQIAAVAGKVRLQIAPMVGTSVEAATPLTQELATKARQRNITLAGSTDTTETHVLKGYFSVLTEGPDTTVVYVWDVYDPSGNRLHRISGQQKAPSLNGQQGWPAVAPATMQAIADQTIDQLTVWLAGNAG